MELRSFPASYYSTYAVLCCLLLMSPPLVRASVEESAKEDLKLKHQPKPMRVFTDEDLSLYDGSRDGRPIYMAVKGVVFDVTTGAEFYGKGAGYNALAGKDCTRAVAKMSLNPEDLTSDVTGLSKAELDSLDQIFEEVYMAKYPVIGHMAFTAVDMNATPLYKSEL